MLFEPLHKTKKRWTPKFWKNGGVAVTVRRVRVAEWHTSHPNLLWTFITHMAKISNDNIMVKSAYINVFTVSHTALTVNTEATTVFSS